MHSIQSTKTAEIQSTKSKHLLATILIGIDSDIVIASYRGLRLNDGTVVLLLLSLQCNSDSTGGNVFNCRQHR